MSCVDGLRWSCHDDSLEFCLTALTWFGTPYEKNKRICEQNLVVCSWTRLKVDTKISMWVFVLFVFLVLTLWFTTVLFFSIAYLLYLKGSNLKYTFVSLWISFLKQFQYLIHHMFTVLNSVNKCEVSYGVVIPVGLRYLTNGLECRLSQILSSKCPAQEWSNSL